jgi:dolichyl-diphosphooligosaccharide---protein glycosyltransferase
MVRLMLTLTPVVCVCGGIVVSEILTTYLELSKSANTDSTADGTSSRQGRSSESQEPTGIITQYETLR